MTFGMDFSSYKDRKKISLQFTFPSSALNVCSLVCFNQAADKIYDKG